ncbi:MAG: type II toxin-antitoxin system HicA family toxin [Candidatus Eremiobacteraeota bacterium]|nr:type II toxin-antitoxin system HicA family toxin [Candidatus Eremiobacteraeota bacterium]
MAKLPQVRPDRLVRVLKHIGFRVDRQRGSHVTLEHEDGRAVTVPMHARRDVPPGLLSSILEAAKMTADELRALL